MFVDKTAIERKNRLEFIKERFLMVILSEYTLKRKNSMEMSLLIQRLRISNSSMSSRKIFSFRGGGWYFGIWVKGKDIYENLGMYRILGIFSIASQKFRNKKG